MFSIVKGVFRTGVLTTVIVGALAGGAVLIAGPARTKAAVHEIHGHINASIDDALGDPAAVRAQLQELEKEYPKRISQVRGDLAELNEQVRQLERERSISQRVVALADRDLSKLEPALQQAATAQATGGASRVAVSVDNHVYSLDRANSKVNQIRQTKLAYSNRAADADHDLVYLHQQENRLQELLVQLENERAQFQSQIQQLSRQVDSIARNERLINLLEKRNQTIESCSRYDVSSLDQLTGRLAEIRSRQEAELDLLSSSRQGVDYEDMARMQINGEVAEAYAFDAQEIEMPTVLTPIGH